MFLSGVSPPKADANFPVRSAPQPGTVPCFLGSTEPPQLSPFGIHGSFWDHIRDLQFVQDRAGLLFVRVVTNPKPDRHQIERILEERLPMVKLEVEYVTFIERNPNGKRRYFRTTADIAPV